MDLIRLQAQILREKLLKNHQLAIDAKTKLQNFCVSGALCNRFVNVHGLKCKALYGEAGTAPNIEVGDSMQNLREKLVYNVFEIALVFKLLPRRTYILPEESNLNLRRTKTLEP